MDSSLDLPTFPLLAAAGLVASGLAPDLTFPALLRHPDAARTHVDVSCLPSTLQLENLRVPPVRTWEDYLHNRNPGTPFYDEVSGDDLCGTCAKTPVHLAAILGADHADDPENTKALWYWATVIGVLATATRRPDGWVDASTAWNVPRMAREYPDPGTVPAVTHLRTLAMRLYLEIVERRLDAAHARHAATPPDAHRFMDHSVRDLLTQANSEAPAVDEVLYVQLQPSPRPIDLLDYPAMRCGDRRLFTGASLLRHLQRRLIDEDLIPGQRSVREARWLTVTEPLSLESLRRMDRALELAENLDRTGDVTDVARTLDDLVTH